MIHRIEPGFLRTNDALNRRDRRQGRRRQRQGDDSPRDGRPPTAAPPLREERESAALDLVA